MSERCCYRKKPVKPPPAKGLATRYEQLREQVLHGGGERRSTSIAVLLHQGLWAWLTLVAAEETLKIAHREPVPSNRTATLPAHVSLPAAPVPSELLAAWTDLVVGVAVRKEVAV